MVTPPGIENGGGTRTAVARRRQPRKDATFTPCDARQGRMRTGIDDARRPLATLATHGPARGSFPDGVAGLTADECAEMDARLAVEIASAFAAALARVGGGR